ncbi:MAG TPA: flagellar basal body rod protein FlgB [Clostridiales bacterium]|jgi:flagellar basal-body rod protein FlgB|nr:flagellar basal body rod protein FlgB [Clostridiales bacterium]
MWDNLFTSVNLLGKGMEASWLRNEVISNNIANVDTVGFKASSVQFEEIMASALGDGDSKMDMSVTHEKHISKKPLSIDDVEPVVVKDESSSVRYDENSVNIESEMVALAKNSIHYYSMVSKINSEFRKLDMAINID